MSSSGSTNAPERRKYLFELGMDKTAIGVDSALKVISQLGRQDYGTPAAIVSEACAELHLIYLKVSTSDFFVMDDRVPDPSPSSVNTVVEVLGEELS
ncbi:hypothetical protein NDU88_005260 [Pleurodeles waltl]|uniref:Uncharacterized protein n=1 Tax=Pleurodeles waltl TaxID=8319 RepID=A0AAV7TUV5_PLEWA|nr:hypothetical protein NDU88_005260 [Pleurodeles waltl]